MILNEYGDTLAEVPERHAEMADSCVKTCVDVLDQDVGNKSVPFSTQPYPGAQAHNHSDLVALMLSRS